MVYVNYTYTYINFGNESTMADLEGASGAYRSPILSRRKCLKCYCLGSLRPLPGSPPPQEIRQWINHKQYLRLDILSNQHNEQKRCNRPYFPQSLCCTRTVTVITICTSHCVSLISLTTEHEKPPLFGQTSLQSAGQDCNKCQTLNTLKLSDQF